MARATVHSTICGYAHVIQGRREGKVIIIDINTSCKKIQGMSHMDIPIMEIFDIKDNYVTTKAKELRCSSNCLVPCGVLHVCRIEAGLLSQALCQKAGGISITFDDE